MPSGQSVVQVGLKGATAFAVSPLARAQGEPPAGDDGATVRSPTFDERAAAAPPPEPLVASPPAKPESPPVDARQAGPPKGRPPEELSITMVKLPIPAELLAQLGRLPFKPPTPGNELARTLQVPVHNPRKGETAPLGDDSIAKAVAALPFVGATVGAGVVSFPRLSIQRYASLRGARAVAGAVGRDPAPVSRDERGGAPDAFGALAGRARGEPGGAGDVREVTIDQIVSAIRALPVLERLRVIEIVAHEAASDVPAALAESAPTRSVTLAERNGLLVVDSDAFVAADAFDHRLDREVRTDRIWGGGS